MAIKRLLLGALLSVIACATVIGNAFALDTLLTSSDSVFTVTIPQGQGGVYNIWVPTYASSYPVNATSFPEILRSDFPYSYVMDSATAIRAKPFFPKLRGKFWHAWTVLYRDTLSSGEHTLTFRRDTSTVVIPDRVFITSSDYCPPDSLRRDSHDVWIEAEDAFEHNFAANPTTYSRADAYNGILKDPTKFGIGGGKVLRLNDSTLPDPLGYYYAKYNLEVKATGYYEIWYHGYAPTGGGWWASAAHSPFTWDIDSSGNRHSYNPTQSEGRPDINSHQSYGWYHLETISIDSGSHIFDIRVNDTIQVSYSSPIYEQMLDAFMLIKTDNQYSSSSQKIPCDITSVSQYLARISGLDQTNVFYPEENKVLGIALDRRMENRSIPDSLIVKYKIADYYNDTTSFQDTLFCQSGSITDTITIQASLYVNTGLYHVTAQFYHFTDTTDEVAYLDTYFGVIYENKYRGRRDSSIFGAAQDAVLYEHLKKAGIKWVRSYKAEWQSLQPDSTYEDSSKYNWSALDREIAKLKENDMNIICCFQHSSIFASTEPVTPIDTFLKYYPITVPNTYKWKGFVEDLVTRYRDSIKCWELWNEPWPHSYNWRPMANGDYYYRELTEATYEAIKQADSTAILGAYGWQTNLIHNGYGACHDAQTFHPYTSDAPEGYYLGWSWWDMRGGDWCNSHLPDIYGNVNCDPDSLKQAWVTENIIGFGLNLQYSDPLKWADWLVRTYTLSLAWGVDHYCYFDFDDWCLGEFGGGSGLINPDCTPRYPYIAHAIMAYLIEGTRFDSASTAYVRPYIPSKMWAYVFDNASDTTKPVAVFWSTDGKTGSVNIGCPDGVAVLNIMGDTVGAIVNGKYNFNVSSSPVYIIANSITALKESLATIETSNRTRVPDTHKICFSHGDNGSITPDCETSSTDTVTVGDEDMTSFTITPDSGYCLDTIIVNDTSKAGTMQYDYHRLGIITNYTFSPVFTDQRIRVTFKPIVYTITASVADSNSSYGSVSPESQDVPIWDTACGITYSPNSGYHISTITDNGVSQAISNPYTITNVTETHNVVYTFKPEYAVTASVADSNSSYGSVSPTSQYIPLGGTACGIAYSPNSGYTISTITDNGVQKTISNPYTITNVTEPHNVVYTFKPEYTVTASGIGCTVSPDTQYIPLGGTTCGIGINAGEGYIFYTLTDNGVSKSYSNPYTITNVTEPHNVVVTFKAIVTASVADSNSSYGSVSPTSQNVPIGGTACGIAYSPNSGYHISTITDNGVSQAISNPYTITNVTEPHNVVYTFKPEYLITASSTDTTRGTVSPESQYVPLGGSTWGINISRKTGYVVDTITDNGVPKSYANPYTITNVDTTHNVVVTFKPQ